MDQCAGYGGETNGLKFKLGRFTSYGIVAVSKKGWVPMCEECHKYYSRGNHYRIAGGVIVFGGLLLGTFLATVVGLGALWLWPVCIAVGLYLVVKGRRRIAALEKRVGF